MAKAMSAVRRKAGWGKTSPGSQKKKKAASPLPEVDARRGGTDGPVRPGRSARLLRSADVVIRSHPLSGSGPTAAPRTGEKLRDEERPRNGASSASGPFIHSVSPADVVLMSWR